MINKQLDARRARLAVSMVEYALKLAPNSVLEEKRGTAMTAYARQLAMYAVYVGFGISLARVAGAFGRDRSTVAYACHQIEDRRDDPALDMWLDNFDTALRQAALLMEEKAA